MRPTLGPIVWQLQDPPISGKGFRPDTSRAERYGTLVMVLKEHERPGLNPNLVLLRIIEVLRDFDPGRDYLLYAGGDPWGPMLLGVAMAEIGHSRWRFLRYERSPDRGSFRYVPTELALPASHNVEVASDKQTTHRLRGGHRVP